MNANVHRQLNRRKRRITRRIENKPGVERHQPMMAASNIHYEISERVRGIAPGGIGAIHLLARKLGLIEGMTGTSTCSSGTCRTTRATTS